MKSYKNLSPEEKKEYQKQVYKRWYERNKEKKKLYQRERYSKLKAEKEANQ